MGRLHDRMAEDLRLRKFSPATQRNYLFYARRFVAFFMRSPEELGEAEVRRFLLHQIEVKHLSYAAYRQIYALAGLKKAYQAGQLRLTGSVTHLGDPRAFQQLLQPLHSQNWVVYAKRPFGGATQVFRYLGRYSHRVAIANSRLVSMDHDRVSFRWKDYADNHRTKVMTVSAEEFIRRWLLHVLPKGFVRIRHFGLLASVNVATKLQRCRQLLGQETPSGPQPAKGWIDRVLEWTGQDPRRCPHCHGLLERHPLLKSPPDEGQEPAAVLATHGRREEVRADSS